MGDDENLLIVIPARPDGGAQVGDDPAQGAVDVGEVVDRADALGRAGVGAGDDLGKEAGGRQGGEHLLVGAAVVDAVVVLAQPDEVDGDDVGVGRQEDAGGLLDAALGAEVGAGQRRLRQEVPADLGAAAALGGEWGVGGALRATLLVEDGATVPHEVDLRHVLIVWQGRPVSRPPSATPMLGP